GDATAGDGHGEIELAGELHQLERLAHDHATGLATEELVERTIVHGDLAGTRLHVDAGRGGLATAGAIVWFGCCGHEIDSLNFELLGLLGGVRMFVAREHMQLLVHLAAERALGEHALHREFNGALGMLLEELAESDGLDTTDGAGVMPVDLVVELVARDFDLSGVQHDDVVAGVNVRGERGLVLALEAHGDLRAQTAQHLVGRVDDIPVAAHGFILGKYSRLACHHKTPDTGRARAADEAPGYGSLLRSERRAPGKRGASVLKGLGLCKTRRNPGL